MKVPSNSVVTLPSTFLEVSVMEGKPSPHLKKVLKSYQLTAANTLSGPNSVLSRLDVSSSNSLSNGPPTSAVNIISSSLAASHGSLIGGPPHYGLKIEKCIKALASGDLQNSHYPLTHGAPIKLFTSSALKSRFDSPGACVRPTSSDLSSRDKASLNPLEKEIKKEPDDDFSPKNDDGDLLENATPVTHVNRHRDGEVNGHISSSTSFSSSESSNESSCSPKQASSPIATVNLNSPSGNYLAKQDRFKEHTPEEMIAATALTYVRELPPNGLHVTREVVQTGSLGMKGQPALHRSSSVANSHGGVPLPNPPSPHLAAVYQPQPPPILSTPDRSRTEKLETLLEGEYISCFVVGGEKRLCFPQILTSVLRPFTLHQINQVCDELQIFCSRCSSDQLEVLKLTVVIPMNAHSCGLITKTDAERLVNSLLHRNPPKSILTGQLGMGMRKDSKAANTFRVYHECFGKCKGTVMQHLYEKPDALCIECVECHGLFSPIRFVAHSHRRQENRTCHWGFDSANWRHYLMLSRDQEDADTWEKALEDFKGKFEHKRKETAENASKEPEDHVVIKKVRYNSPTPLTSPMSSTSFESSCLPTKKRLPFFQYSENDQTVITDFDLESVKKLVLARMGTEGGAGNVITLLEKMALRISSLEQICKKQESTIRNITEAKSGAELQAKVNTMEAELHSLKTQLLRRHGQRDEM